MSCAISGKALSICHVNIGSISPVTFPQSLYGMVLPFSSQWHKGVTNDTLGKPTRTLARIQNEIEKAAENEYHYIHDI